MTIDNDLIDNSEEMYLRDVPGTGQITYFDGNWGVLEQFGIRYITGEPCALGIRILCDLTEEGVGHVSEFLGIKADAFHPNWNSNAVASVLLPHTCFHDLLLLLLARSGYKAAIITTDYGVAATTDEGMDAWVELKKAHKGMGSLKRHVRLPSITRHEHAMSGRVY